MNGVSSGEKSHPCDIALLTRFALQVEVVFADQGKP
jgi:hypothetical protein